MALQDTSAPTVPAIADPMSTATFATASSAGAVRARSAMSKDIVSATPHRRAAHELARRTLLPAHERGAHGNRETRGDEDAVGFPRTSASAIPTRMRLRSGNWRPFRG